MIRVLRGDSRSATKNRRPGAISRAQRKPALLEEDQCAIRHLEREADQPTVKEIRQRADNCRIAEIPISARAGPAKRSPASACWSQQVRPLEDPVVDAMQLVDVLHQADEGRRRGVRAARRCHRGRPARPARAGCTTNTVGLPGGSTTATAAIATPLRLLRNPEPKKVRNGAQAQAVGCERARTARAVSVVRGRSQAGWRSPELSSVP